MAALVAVMIMVSIGTFSWRSLTNLVTHPKSSSVVMVATVVVVVFTHDLAKGVLVGVLLSGIFFAQKVGQLLSVQVSATGERSRLYTVSGQVFFASADKFNASFDYSEDVTDVVIDVSHAHFWDITSVGTLDKVVMKFRRLGAKVEVIGLNQASSTMIERFGLHDKIDGVEDIIGH